MNNGVPNIQQVQEMGTALQMYQEMFSFPAQRRDIMSNNGFDSTSRFPKKNYAAQKFAPMQVELAELANRA
jgi:hypothetical protein